MHLICTEKNKNKKKNKKQNTNTKNLQTLAYKTNISQFTLEWVQADSIDNIKW